VTTYTPFVPSPLSPFQFQPVLDGTSYVLTVPALLGGNRYYMQLSDLSGTLILYRALTGSPSGVAIQSLVWNQGVVEVVTAAAHGFPPAHVERLNFQNNLPDTFNGTQDCLVTGLVTMSFSLPDDPGSPSSLGTVSQDINLVYGYFNSTLVFREDSQTFEVSP
jgi:hypothetical protein